MESECFLTWLILRVDDSKYGRNPTKKQNGVMKNIHSRGFVWFLERESEANKLSILL